jgi:hypothetical protein
VSLALGVATLPRALCLALRVVTSALGVVNHASGVVTLPRAFDTTYMIFKVA